MRFSCGRAALQVIVLKEQPIALQETVVAAKSSKQRNKRKQMATLLHAVYVQLEKEFPDEPAQYQVVSDVRMTSGEAQTGHAAVLPLPAKICLRSTPAFVTSGTPAGASQQWRFDFLPFARSVLFDFCPGLVLC